MDIENRVRDSNESLRVHFAFDCRIFVVEYKREQTELKVLHAKVYFTLRIFTSNDLRVGLTSLICCTTAHTTNLLYHCRKHLIKMDHIIIHN